MPTNTPIQSLYWRSLARVQRRARARWDAWAELGETGILPTCSHWSTCRHRPCATRRAAQARALRSDALLRDAARLTNRLALMF